PDSPDFLPDSAFTVKTVQGWKVHVHEDVRKEKAIVGALDEQLSELRKQLSSEKRVKAQKIPIWLHLHRFKNRDEERFIEFHSNESWLIRHHRNPSMTMSIEISDARKLLQHKEQTRERLLELMTVSYRFGNDKVKSHYLPTEEFTIKKIEGWKVYVHRKLLNDEKETGEKMMRVMQFQLYFITQQLSGEVLDALRSVPIWIHLNTVGDRRGTPAAELHWSRRWLENNGRNPEMVKSIEIGNVKKFLTYAHKRNYILLHELAHGYHAKAMSPEDDRALQELYRKATEKNMYRNVLHFGGHKADAYGSTRYHEYFAEAVVAYFGHCQNYPFVRPELKEYDPEMYAFIEKVFQLAKADNKQE
ncbi:MAG: hypothetical protein AAF492_27025, partial [Verrucomicrobiota bacterium]